jgi:hypothetical protein
VSPLARRWIVHVFGLKLWAVLIFLLLLSALVLGWIWVTWPNLHSARMVTKFSL